MSNILDTLVTDRSQADVDRAWEMNRKGWAKMGAEERAEYLAGPRGAYTRHDLNRVVEAMEYLEGLMARTGVASAYRPVQIRHVTAQGTWTDGVWTDADKVRPAQWAAHLANVEQYWDYVCAISAAVAPRWDPRGRGWGRPEDRVKAGDVCRVEECCGLVSLTVRAACDRALVSVSGTGWTVEAGEEGWTAVYRYLGGPFPDVGDALGALQAACRGPEGTARAVLSFSARLRRGEERALGQCEAVWSPLLSWGEFEKITPLWGSLAGKTWDQATRGGGTDG